MERRSSRVSEAQWSILIEFLETHPNLARARGYNNSARGRSESLRLWQEEATSLNSEGSGTFKTPKEWSVYVTNYKSKLKKVVSETNADATATGGGPPRAGSLSSIDERFLALLGPGFGQTAPQVRVQPFTNTQPSTSTPGPELVEDTQDVARHEEVDIEVQEEVLIPIQDTSNVEPILPRRRRQIRQRTRPLAPLDEARRVLAEVEMQRAAADAATARALETTAHNLRPLEDLARNLGRVANVAERYLEYIISLGATGEWDGIAGEQ